MKPPKSVGLTLSYYEWGKEIMVLVQQQGNIECGIGALSMILQSFGVHIPYKTLKDEIELSEEGASIFEIQKAADKYNIETVAYDGSSDEFLESISTTEIKLPCIVRISNPDGIPHYVVINHIFKNGDIRVYDPSGLKYKLSQEQFNAIFLGQVISFKKTGKLKKIKKKNPFLCYVKEVLKKPINILSIIVIMTISAITTILSLIPSFVMKYITDEITKNHEITEITAVMITFSFISILIGYIFRIIQGKLTVHLSAAMLQEQFGSSYSGLIRQPLQFFNKTATGDIQERFLDSTQISGTVLQLLFSAFEIIVMVISGFIMASISETMLLTSIVIFIISIIASLVFNQTLTISAQETAVESSKTMDILRETSEGILTIKALNAEDDLKTKFFTKVNDLKKAISKAAVKNIKKDSVSDVVQGIGFLVLLWLSAVNIVSGDMEIGSLIMISTLYSYFLSPADSFSNLYAQIVEAEVQSERLDEIAGNKENIDKSCNEEDINDGSVKVNNVSFAYKANNNKNVVIDNFSLDIQDGSCVAISGESGKGKSTLAKLISGIEKPDTGTILIGGADICDINDDIRAENIQYIPQFPYFINDTYRKNLLLGIKDKDNKISDDDIYNVLNKLGADFVTNLDNKISENGNNLSGGQRQKLAIARSLLRNPRILIMDESTSSIDAEGQSKILEFTKSLKCTRIIISHDDSVTSICEKTVYLT